MLRKISLQRLAGIAMLFLLSLTTTFAVNSVKSPFFVVKPVEGDTRVSLPLIHTEADVNIVGVIADVKVRQMYVNSGSVAIEAMYVFPGSSKSAVYGMQMQIGDRITRAEIQEKQKAKATYEKAKSEGKSASLLQQHRPNVFQMNVANIIPGDTIIVELSYTELLTPENGIYEFVYPTVVGPRYASKSDLVNNTWVNNMYTQEQTYEAAAKTHTFDINVHVEAGLEIASISSTSHEVDIVKESSANAEIGLSGGKGYEGNRDYILKYQLAGEQINSGMLLFEGEEENFFLMMMQPPKRVAPEEIPPREYIFIVDVSGSMNGFPIEISKKLIKELITSLRPTDKFNVLLFAGSSEMMAEESIPATRDNLRRAIYTLEQKSGSGGTEILPALKRAMDSPKQEGYSRTIVIATDGLVTLEKEAFDLIRENLGEANVFPFGIGTSTNRFIIDGLAHAGQGESFLATTKKEAEEAAAWFKKYIESPVLTNIKTSFAGMEVYDVEPKSTPDVFAERPVIVFGKYKGKPSGKVTVKGISGKSPYQMNLNLSDYKPTAENEALKYLWARQRITILSDYTKLDRSVDQKTIAAITDLGIKYNLMTDYTSFVAVDHQVRDIPKRANNLAPNKGDESLLSDRTYAMNSSLESSINAFSSPSGSGGAVPEPSEWALIIMLFIFSFWLFRYKSR